MSDDTVLFIEPSDTSVGITPDGNVSFLLGRPHLSLGFDPKLVLAMQLTPGEARRLAEVLSRKADEAEAGSARH